MPVYLNELSTTVKLIGMEDLGPGETGSPIPNKYLRQLPTGVSLAAHSPAPWKTLHADTIGSDVLTGLSKYRQITITNNSGDVLEVAVNQDYNNLLYILNGATWPIHQDREIEVMEFSGSGEGKIYVLGWR